MKDQDNEVIKHARAKLQTVETNRSARDDSGNGSKPPDGHSRKVRVQRSAQIAGLEAFPKVPARKVTGPRTKLGKQRSRYNALKHGIFSKVLLLDGESETEYQSLVAGLRAARQPRGALEESLVENLAVLMWRKRRLLEAERAEIAKAREFEVLDWAVSSLSQRDEVIHKALDMEDRIGGMLHEWSNPFVLAECISLLKGLREDLEQNGFDPRHEKILGKIYGPVGGFLCAYLELSQEARSASANSVDGTNSVYEEKRAEALKLLAAEIKERRTQQVDLFAIAKHRIEYIKQAASVPSQEVLERLLRYEASLSREVDRTLRQLERLQRMRLGQPVPPSIQLEVSP
jgi:hypothetical protein